MLILEEALMLPVINLLTLSPKQSVPQSFPEAMSEWILQSSFISQLL